MAFINERITNKEDIEKYDLRKLWDYYAYMKKENIISLSAKEIPYDWTIDRDKEIFLIYVGKFLDQKLLGDHDRVTYYTKENMFIFYFKNEFYEIRLMRERASYFW